MRFPAKKNIYLLAIVMAADCILITSLAIRSRLRNAVCLPVYGKRPTDRSLNLQVNHALVGSIM